LENNLQWLWAMATDKAAFYRIDPHRSKEAFEKLIQTWEGILVSDSYGLYCNRVHGRQTCLAHLIRKADGLCEREKPELKQFGQIMACHLRQLVRFSKDPSSKKQGSDYYSHLLFALFLWEAEKNDAGKLARQIVREMDSLWTFLEGENADPANNRAERALRFGGPWREPGLGTQSEKAQSEKGNRWVEGILSLKETCRLAAKSTFQILLACSDSYFNNQPDLSRI